MTYPLRLGGDLVVLRDFTHNDVDDALKIVGDERVTAFLSFDSRTREQTEAMLNGAIERAKSETRNEYYLAATPHDSDQVIGFARLGLSGVKAAKLGYAITASEWGKGYATTAARVLLDFAFGELQLHRVTAAIGPDNAASMAVVAKLGFHREGVLRDHVFTNGAWRDSVLFSLLADEWAGQ